MPWLLRTGPTTPTSPTTNAAATVRSVDDGPPRIVTVVLDSDPGREFEYPASDGCPEVDVDDKVMVQKYRGQAWVVDKLPVLGV